MSIAACRPSVMTLSRMSSPFWARPLRSSISVDALGQHLLVVPERVARRGGDELALAAFDAGQLQVAAQVVLLHDVRDAAEHIDQLGDVDELAEPFDRLVGAGRLQLEFGAGVAEGVGPGVELVHAALAQQALVLDIG